MKDRCEWCFRAACVHPLMRICHPCYTDYLKSEPKPNKWWLR